jgi:hypothetical protein
MRARPPLRRSRRRADAPQVSGETTLGRGEPPAHGFVLLALRDWLCAHQVAVVGMTSTGAYWKPVDYRLEDDLEC